MSLLLDTNVMLFGLMEPDKIPVHIRRMISDPDQACIVSAVSLYEIGLKTALGKLAIPDSFDLVRHVRRSQMEILSVTAQHATRAARLPLDHRDPWDRVIAAQCLVDGHQLVSADETISALGIGRLW